MLFLLPIGDDNKDRTIFPWVNYGLIIVNVLVFFVLQTGERGLKFTIAFSAVPKEIITGKDVIRPGGLTRDPKSGVEYFNPGLGKTPIPVWFTLLTSMFMHGGFGHLLGNMMYLWIFGDNIEDDLGHWGYLAFYLFMGLIAGLAHVFMNAWGPNAEVLCLGASGAIAGVMGAYLLLHPNRKVFILFIRYIVTLPAFVVVGLWFLQQIYFGMGTIGETGGGVAYAAHIGGFLAGLLLVLFFAKEKAPPTFVSRRDIFDMYADNMNGGPSEREEWWARYMNEPASRDD